MFHNKISSVVSTVFSIVSLTQESMKSDRINPPSRFISKIIPVRLFFDLAPFRKFQESSETANLVTRVLVKWKWPDTFLSSTKIFTQHAW